MTLEGVEIRDSFAEAFAMKATRLIITADTASWAETAANSLAGFATSVIACGCEAGIEETLPPAATPDGRPGVAVLIFAVSTKELQKQLAARVGQCVLTAVGSACFSGSDSETRLKLGGLLRYFGDGWQISKRIDGHRYWRLPVMDGEFLVEDSAPLLPGIGGGNFLILAHDAEKARTAAERAVAAMRRLSGIILPFPGGIVRSGSKVGSRYKTLSASTNDAYCPTLKGRPESRLSAHCGAVLEIVIDGLSEGAVAGAMRAGIFAVCADGKAGGVEAIDAGNYGGRLGRFHFPLRAMLG